MYSAVGTGTVLTSAIVFWLFNKFLDDNSMPVKVPEKYSDKTKCKWRNVMGSTVHAVVVSFIGFYCIFRSPEYLSERVTTHTTLGEVNICITIGYLVYDAYDLILFQGVISTWPILIHHFTLHFLGFGCVMYHHESVAYALFGSMIEFNSIFLHGRQLLLMYGFTKDSFVYKVNNALNVFTYITFRLCGGSYMLFACLPADYDKMSPFWFTSFCLSTTVLLGINIILFYRLIRSDFFSRGDRSNGNIMLSSKQINSVASDSFSSEQNKKSAVKND